MMFVFQLFLTICVVLSMNVHGQEPIILESEPSLPYYKNTSTIYISNENITITKQPEQVVDDPIPLQGSSRCTISNFIEAFGYAETGYIIPPDPIGAAGKNRLIAVGNSIIDVRTKNGTIMYRSYLAAFFLPTSSPNEFLFDPKVIYDEHDGRFLIVALQKNDTVSNIYVAVSKNENPDTAGAWYKYKIPSVVVVNGKNAWADYPGLEVDEKAVYITSNMFDFEFVVGGGFIGVRLWIVPKTSVYNGGKITYYGPYNPFWEGYTITTMPAQVHGVGGLGPTVGSYLVSGYETRSNDVYFIIVTIRNPLTSATFELTYVNLGQIAQGGLVPGATQMGGTTRINADALRVYDAVWRNNKLWVTFTINPTSPDINAGQATAHWVRIDTSYGIFTVEDQGNLGGETFSSETSTYFPSIAVNKNGTAAVGYAASSETMYAGAYGSVLLEAGEVPFTVKAGSDYYVQTDSRGRNRWGDYSGTSVDPVDDSFWIFNQYATTRLATKDDKGEDGNWRTAWARVSCTASGPIESPTPAPVVTVPTRTNAPCGLFGLSIFCLFTGCGFFRQLLGLAGC